VTVSAPFPLPAPIAFTAVTLSIDEGDRPGLAIREKALPNEEPFEDVAPIVVDPSFTAVRFRYLRDTEGSWEESWDGAQERAVPRAVEVTLTTMVGGQPVEQPPSACPSGSPRHEPAPAGARGARRRRPRDEPAPAGAR
jgi:hypothetical protein